jgi:hypothetical protein
MGKELYHRFTEIYLPGQPEIENNEIFSNLINSQITNFCKENKVSYYRIINCETQALPPRAGSQSDFYTGYVMLIIHLAYQL